MPDALPPSLQDPARRARRERWLMLAVCVFSSLILHGMLVWLWPGYGGGGVRTARLRASIRSMPAASLPAPVVAPPADAQDVMAAQQPARTASPSNDLQAGLPERRYAQASSQDVPEESGGGRLSEYVPVELLSTRPRFLVDMREYIPASLDASEAGKIVVQVLIGADGEVDGVVIESSGLTPRGTRRFIQRLDALRLQPGLCDGVPVKSRWRMEFDFSPVAE